LRFGIWRVLMADNHRVLQQFRKNLLLLCAALLCAACANQQPRQAAQVTVYAAVSLREAFTALAGAFETANPGTRVVMSFGGSQALAEQIAQAAPVDVFASANQKTMDRAVASGRIDASAVSVFARNRLICVTASGRQPPVSTLADLARPGVKLVLADARVPVGQYALDFLARASASPEFGAAYSATVIANVVSYEEDVRAVFGKVALGEADAGIVYVTDIAAGEAGKVGRIEIPDALNTLAVYPIAALRDAPASARAFAEFVHSPAGQDILKAHGFLPAAAE
jgi:molybdate transport system substrate-binding protein